ncbi:hypothetical protein [Nocardia farcinica]|uniref:Uncharacterized protein n=1 Tax=Nocardia farcinica TaxID=37329 RepID=A0A449H6R5_NOCFR|nr:hypothetical protein [Nocardia farcinica]PFW99718.1 hypothetical protein CJ469_04989 [Nocardia farcinica]PFX06604.1 hypothetical protein CJ468_04369 [Nocardia farcinica]VFA93666.1 Uncharacterised protein [Nocardia farcinica]
MADDTARPQALPWNLLGATDATDGWRLVTNPDPRLRKEWDYEPGCGRGYYAVLFNPVRLGPFRLVVVGGDRVPRLHKDDVTIDEGKALAEEWVTRLRLADGRARRSPGP